MTVAEPSESLLRSLYVTLFERARADVAPSVLVEQARELAAAGAGESTWEAAEPCAIGALRSTRMLHRPARVAAHVVAVTTPRLVKLPRRSGAFETTLATSLVLQDLAGDRIETLALTREARVTRAVDDARRAGTLEFLGTTVALPIGASAHESAFMLHVHDLRRGASTLDILAATSSERRETRSRLAKLRARGVRPIDHMLDQLVAGIGVVGLDDFPLLRQCLRFTVLQALSGGRINHSAGKLHALIVGPPGQGKKLIGVAARLLNPRATEASPSKISAAGLLGASYPTADGWRSQPGLIPQADDGVVLLQDAHGITPTEIAKLAPMLQELIEDGVLRDAKAGGVRREVSVGTLIDVNRLSQVQFGPSRKKSEAAILGLRPLLSRIDLIAEMPLDNERAWEVAAKLYRSQSVRRGRIEDEPWVRELRLMVGELRGRHADVDLSRVHAAMERAHRAIAKESGAKLGKLREASDLPVRLAVSFARYVAASARASDRSVATRADVDEAAPFLALKLQFYAHAEATAPEEPSRAALYASLAGKEVRPADVARAMTKRTGESISERTVRRDLIALGARRAKKGVYRVPAR